MKVLVMKLLVVVVAITLTGKMNANPTSINENNNAKTNSWFSEQEQFNMTLSIYEPNQLSLLAAEERKVNIQVDDTSPNSTASAIITINSLDGLDEFGPYTVNEGENLIITIDERDWFVETLSSSQNAEVTYWITE